MVFEFVVLCVWFVCSRLGLFVCGGLIGLAGGQGYRDIVGYFLGLVHKVFIISLFIFFG